MTDDGGRKTDDGGQRSEVGGRRSEDSGHEGTDLPATLSPRPASRGSAVADWLARRAGVGRQRTAGWLVE